MDLKKMVGDDLVAQYLNLMRDSCKDVEGWPELERIIYDTYSEFDGPPEGVNVAVFPGWEKLTAEEREYFGTALSAYMNDYAQRIRQPMIMALIEARVKLWQAGQAQKQ